MSVTKKTFIIIDGNALLHRAWHALPPLQTKQGVIVNAVYGFLIILLKALNDLKPTYITVAFDTKASTFRDKAFEAYKAQRVAQPDELYAQIPILKNVLAAFHIPVFEKDGFEADDVIGTIAGNSEIRKLGNCEVVIVTGDMDTMQLVDEHTRVMTPKKGMSDTVMYDIAAVQERYGLAPSQMIDYKALRGDPSDNIPGVKGIGEKTATALLQAYGSLENLYNQLPISNFPARLRMDEVQAGGQFPMTERLQKLLLDRKEEAMLSKKLVTIVRDVPIEFDLEKCRWTGGDEAKIVGLFQELGFRSLLSRLPKSGYTEVELPLGSSTSKVSNDRYILVDTEKKFTAFLKELKEQKIFAFDTETDSVNPLRAKLVGMSFSWQPGEAYYIPISPPDFAWTKSRRAGNYQFPITNLGAIFTDAKIAKVAHNAKFDVEVLARQNFASQNLGGLAANGIAVQSLTFDTMVASYLLDPGSRQHGLDKLAFEEFGFRMTQIDELIGKGKKSSSAKGYGGRGQITMAEVPLEKIVPYACADADYTWRLYERFTKELKNRGTEELFQNIEMPLVPVLVAMEQRGIKIDTERLRGLAQRVGERLERLEKEIHTHAGEEFNVQSPLQLKRILFEKLQISTKGIGKTKTGLSTAADELEKMKGAHPIIDPIIEHRELAKLQSTYLEALPKLVDREDGRLHTSFNQTVAATGRLSSSDPNLQNIPIRTELGNEIRKAFIVEQGNVILAADYSQIELRVAAHLSGDPKMIAAFQRGEDFHSRTAAEINDIPIEKVTKEMRRDAKTINFGILYGMGSQSLAAQTSMSRDEARAFIEKYFVVYKQLAAWIEETKACAKSQGYVETLFGRRRYLPEINSGVPMVRAAAERMAVNMPVQGTAADIMKMAMIKIYERTKKRKDERTWMLLQVHDELVFEVTQDAVKEVSVMIRDTMESVTKLKVPLKVDIEVGQNWGELESIQ